MRALFHAVLVLLILFPLRLKTHGQIMPCLFNASCFALWPSRMALSSTVKGKMRASSFLLVPGSSVTVASSKLILRTGHPANLAWRGIIGGAVVEAEPPYKDNGGNDTIRIGGLTVGKNYSVSMDGSAAGVATADSGGTAAVGVNLTTRIVIRLTELNGVIKRSFPGPQSFSFHMRHIPGGIDFTFDGPFGRAISLQICDLQGRTIWSWPGREGPAPSSRIVWTGVDRSGRPASTGVYLVKILGRADFQSALLVYLR